MPDPIDDIVKISPDVHRVIFESAAIRVLEVTVPPGAKVPMHTNPENVNYIVKPGTLRLINPDGSSADIDLAEGQVIPAPVGRHAVENIGTAEVRTICIELKSATRGTMTVRMDHVGIVVEDLAAAIAFFTELGLEQQGDQMNVDGHWVDRVVGLDGVHVEVAMMRTPDSHIRLELTKFLAPTVATGDPFPAPANTLGLRRIMFEVDDIRDTVRRLEKHGGKLVGEIAQYEDVYLLCYLRGPSGIIVALAEAIGA